jgi:hypothetical protein
VGIISNCENSECWLRHECYRYMQLSGNLLGDIATRILVPTPDEGEPCDDYIALMPGDKLREDAP